MGLDKTFQPIKEKILIDFVLLLILCVVAIKGYGPYQKVNLVGRMISADADIRKNAIKDYHTLPTKQKVSKVDAIIKILEDKNNPSRYLAAHTLRKVGPQAAKAIPALIESLNADNYDVRWNAIFALGDLGADAKEAAPRLYPFLKSENKYQQAASAIALVRIGEIEGHLEEIVFQLKSAMHYNDRTTRLRAMTMIGNLGIKAKSAIPDLLKAIRSSDDRMRRHASWALGRMGQRNKEILEALLVAVQDEDHNVRLNALVSIDSLDSSLKHKHPAVKNEWMQSQKGRDFDSALLYSAYEGDARDALDLIKLGANVNVKGYYTGKTALMIAAENGHFNTVKALIETGAEVNIQSDASNTSFHVREPHLPMQMSDLFSFITKFQKKDDYEEKTALHYVIEADLMIEEKMEMVRLLIDHNADPEIKDHTNTTAFEKARALDTTQIVELFSGH